MTKLEKKLKAELEHALAAYETLSRMWTEELNRSHEMRTAAIDAAKLKKQLSIVAHIIAGRANEAITELLDPIIFNFKVEVNMGEEAHAAAQKEMLKQVVENAKSALDRIEIAPKEKK